MLEKAPMNLTTDLDTFVRRSGGARGRCRPRGRRRPRGRKRGRRAKARAGELGAERGEGAAKAHGPRAEAALAGRCAG